MPPGPGGLGNPGGGKRDKAPLRRSGLLPGAGLAPTGGGGGRPGIRPDADDVGVVVLDVFATLPLPLLPPLPRKKLAVDTDPGAGAGLPRRSMGLLLLLPAMERLELADDDGVSAADDAANAAAEEEEATVGVEGVRGVEEDLESTLDFCWWL